MSNDESKDKDEYFQRLAEISNAMVAAHGRDFAIGTLVLAARFVAEHAAPAAAEESTAAAAAQA
ncbi:MAG TPA: hypothetical protein VLI72_02375 [Methylibium sp.]|nr:hypothetical protein [Methylibium sp.]